jgi:glycosyltransferase involved in cell wall biosynthesis
MSLKGKSIIMGSDSSHVPTGYGNVKRKICPYFKNALGMNVMEMGIQNLGNPFFDQDGLEKLPNHKQTPFASQSMLEWIQERRPEYVWYLGDPHWFDWLSKFNVDLTQRDAKWYKSVVYFPIDNDILPRSFVDILQAHDVRVTFTNYGKRICEQYGLDDVKVAHHGVDTNVFKPLPDEQRQKIREQNNFADKFVVGQVNRNNFRKMTPLLMSAFAEFAKNKKDAVLLLHCDPRDSQGFDLPEYLEQLGLQNKVMFNSRMRNAITGVPVEELNVLYNMLDVHASATTGEGWGLTTTEAQAAGCPVIIGDHTTGPELVGKNGWLVPCIEGEDYKVFTQQGGHYFRVQHKGIVDALEAAYADRKKTRQMGVAASKHVRGTYSWDRVNRAWSDILEG